MTDALERLKNRTRPTVRNRDTSLESRSPDVSTSRELEIEKPQIYDTLNSALVDTPTSRLLESEQPAIYNISTSTPLDISTSGNLDSDVPASPESSAPRNLDISTSQHLNTSMSPQVGVQKSGKTKAYKPRNLEVQNANSPDISTSLLQETTISGNLMTETGLQTKQSTLRLEQGVSDRLQDLCRHQSICREVLIEALFEWGEAHPDGLADVLVAAKAKNSQRQHMANQRRAQSMMQRFGQA